MIQIDMQMPSNCIDCPACNEYLMCAIPANGRGCGENNVKDFSQGRPEWCPMKEQKAVVRCKDCKHHGSEDCPLFTDAVEFATDDDWFCGDGEPKDGDWDG